MVLSKFGGKEKQLRFQETRPLLLKVAFPS
jgi:hypothetical protein